MEWYPLKFYESSYQINNEGEIKSIDRNTVDKLGRIYRRKGKVLKQVINNMGYYVVNLGRGNYELVHRLIAIQFIENNDKSKNCINHIDGNKLNNDLSNLEWCTKRENNSHAIDKKLNTIKKPVRAISVLKDEILYFESARQASEILGINYKDISACCNGRQKTAKGFKWEFIK